MFRKYFIFLTSLLLIFAASSALAKGNNIVKMHSDIEVAKGESAGEVVCVGGNVTVGGRVEGNVVAVAGGVTLGPGSYVGGEVVCVGGNVVKDPSAVISGKITQVYIPHFIPSVTSLLKGGWLALWAAVSMLVLVGFLGLAVLLIALMPDHVGTAVNALERSFFTMLLWGVLWMLLVIPVAVFLAISIIGIALIPLEILLVVLALVMGYISAAIFVGKNVLLAFNKMPPPFVDAILGIIILFLTGFIPVIGPAVKALFLIAGFGAVVSTRFGSVK